MTTALYNRDILRLAASVPHFGRLADAQAHVERRSPVCGSRVAVDLVMGQDGRVERLGQEVNACALGQASASLMGAAAIGRTAAELEEARQALADYLGGGREDPGAWPGIGVLKEARPYAARHASILLPFEAVAEAARLAGARKTGRAA